MGWEGSLAVARATRRVATRWLQELYIQRGIKQKGKYIENTKSQHFLFLEKGTKDMERRRTKMSSLVLEWSWSYHYEQQLLMCRLKEKIYMYVDVCMYIHRHVS